MARRLRVYLAIPVTLVMALLSLTLSASAQSTSVVPVMPTVNGQVCDRTTGEVSPPQIAFVDNGSGIEYYDVSVSGNQSVYDTMVITASAKLPAGKSWGNLPTDEMRIETNNGTLYGKWSNPWNGDPQGAYLTFKGQLSQDFCRILISLVPDLPTVADYTCKNGYLVPVVSLPQNTNYIEYKSEYTGDSWNFMVWARKSSAIYDLNPLGYDVIWKLPPGNDLGTWKQFDERADPYFDGTIEQTPCTNEVEPTASPRGPYVCTLRFDQSISDWRVASLAPAEAYVKGWIEWSEALNDYVLPGGSDQYSWCDHVPDGWTGDEGTTTPTSPVGTETPAATETPVPNAFKLTSAVRACADQRFSATWSGSNIASIEFALSNTSDDWTSGWLTADPTQGSFTSPIDHHAYDKVVARVTFADGTSEIATADVGTCGAPEQPTTPPNPTTPSKSGGSVTSLPVTGAGENGGVSATTLIAATALLGVAAVGGLGSRRQRG